MQKTTNSLLLVGLLLAVLAGLVVVVGPSLLSNDAEADPVADPDATLGASSSNDTTTGETTTRVEQPAEARNTPPEPIDRERDLHGLVLDPRDRPVAGASVIVWRREGHEYELLDRSFRQRREVARTQTDRDGRFRVRLSPGTPHLVSVSATGHPTTWRSDCYAGQRLVVRLQAAAAIEGRVTDKNGAPVAEVVLRGSRRGIGIEGPGVVFEGSTDADGHYRLTGLEPGPVSLEIDPPRHSSPRDVELDLVAGETTHHDVVLRDASTIRGRVIDAVTGQPIAGAKVGEAFHGHRFTTTDASGRYVLPAFSDLYFDILCKAEGYCGDEKRVRTRFGQPPVEVVDFALERGHIALGRIVGPRGEPLAGVYVAAPATRRRGRNGPQLVDWPSTRSREDGSFVVKSLRPDMRHVLFCVKDGYGTMVYDFPASEARQAKLDLGLIRLPKAAMVQGAVADEHGEPLQRQKVELHGCNEDRRKISGVASASNSEDNPYQLLDYYVTERNARTGDLGRFTFTDLAPGRYELRARPRWVHRTSSQVVVVSEGAKHTGIRMLVHRGRTIAGTVRATDGGPLPKVYISVDPYVSATTAGDVEVDSDGSFRIGGLEDGVYKLSVYCYASESDKARGRLFRNQVVEDVSAGTADVEIRLERKR